MVRTRVGFWRLRKNRSIARVRGVIDSTRAGAGGSLHSAATNTSLTKSIKMTCSHAYHFKVIPSQFHLHITSWKISLNWVSRGIQCSLYEEQINELGINYLNLFRMLRLLILFSKCYIKCGQRSFPISPFNIMLACTLRFPILNLPVQIKVSLGPL